MNPWCLWNAVEFSSIFPNIRYYSISFQWENFQHALRLQMGSLQGSRIREDTTSYNFLDHTDTRSLVLAEIRLGNGGDNNFKLISLSPPMFLFQNTFIIFFFASSYSTIKTLLLHKIILKPLTIKLFSLFSIESYISWQTLLTITIYSSFTVLE